MIKAINCSTRTVKQILSGEQTVLRKVIKPQPKMRLAFASMGHGAGKWHYPGKDTWRYWGEEYRYPDSITPDDEKRVWTPPCRGDDILYVRETWNRVKAPRESSWHYEYRASCQNPAYFSDGFMAEWRPSIHMPREAARIFLRVTDVRMEQLQDITEEQAREVGPALPDFIRIWDASIKKSDIERYGWDANPWVWVIEFERCEKPKNWD